MRAHKGGAIIFKPAGKLTPRRLLTPLVLTSCSACPSPTNPALQLSIDFPALGSAGWTPQVAARVVATIADAAELPRRKVNVTDFRPVGSAMVGTYHGVEAVVSVATPWPDVVGGRLVRARAALQELRATGRPDETRIRSFITKISECQRRAGA